MDMHTTGTDTMAMTMTHATMPAMTSGAGHDMEGMGNGCKISMLFNLNTVGSCFLSSGWKITSNSMFAGSCIGVFLLAIILELLRRSIKEYDRYLIKQHLVKHQSAIAAAATSAPATEGESVSSKTGTAAGPVASCPATIPPFRPSVLQQAIRAFLHLLAFVDGYILMLLAMYYNGYMILCIFLGVFFGAFAFQWETLSVSGQQTSAAQEPTVCCG